MPALTPTPSERPSIKTLPSVTYIQNTKQPSLSDLKLSHVLNNETCPPISFNDFAQFTAKKEFTLENLLFVLWFRSFQYRWSLVPSETRSRVPIPSTLLGDRYRPFEYLDNRPVDHLDPVSAKSVSSSSFRKASQLTPPLATSASDNSNVFEVCDWTKGNESDCTVTPSAQGSNVRKRFFEKNKPSIPDEPVKTNGRPPLPPLSTEFTKVEDQPMREEAVSAFATFLNKGGSRELGISDELRHFAKTCLQRSCAPESFLPIYDEVYQALETQSLPHFLDHAKGNVNRPKALFWYLVGTIDFLMGVAIFLILTLLLTDKKFAYRAIRLPSTIFTWFGVAQIYSAYRGFCSQVWGRRSIQLRPWEMDQGDEEILIDTPFSTPLLPDQSSIKPINDLDPTCSISSELVFTPDLDSRMELHLPNEVFPLTDLSGVTSSAPVDELPWGSAVVYDQEEMDEIAKRQLATRRATIKVPDASLAFPIEVPRTPTTDLMDPPTRFESHNGPNSPGTPKTLRPTRNAEGYKAESKTNPLNKTALMDLDGLMDDMHNKTKGKPIGRVQMFGPEKIVTDPRIVKLYDTIVRDITIVASVFGVIWIGLCFAVPTAGLVR